MSCHSDIFPCPNADSCHFSAGDFWPSDSGCTCLGPRVWLIFRTSPGQQLHAIIRFLEQRPVHRIKLNYPTITTIPPPSYIFRCCGSRAPPTNDPTSIGEHHPVVLNYVHHLYYYYDVNKTRERESECPI